MHLSLRRKHQKITRGRIAEHHVRGIQPGGALSAVCMQQRTKRVIEAVQPDAFLEQLGAIPRTQEGAKAGRQRAAQLLFKLAYLRP